MAITTTTTTTITTTNNNNNTVTRRMKSCNLSTCHKTFYYSIPAVVHKFLD